MNTMRSIYAKPQIIPVSVVSELQVKQFKRLIHSYN
jgi:hypothetical protein